MVTDEKRPTPNMITGCQKNYQIINSLILETSFFSEIHCYQFKVLSSVDLILSDYQFKNALHVWFTTVPFNLTLHGIKKDITIFLSKGGLSSWYSYCFLRHKSASSFYKKHLLKIFKFLMEKTVLKLVNFTRFHSE